MSDSTIVCGACGRILTAAEERTTCGNCNEMYHSCCVYSTAAETKWYCPEGCLQRNVENARAKDRSDPASSAPEASGQPAVVAESNMSEVAQVALEQHAEEFDADRWIREKQFEIELELAARQAQIDRELRKREERMAEAFQKAMRRQEVALEVGLRKKADHERRMAELERSFQRRSSVIDKQLEQIKFSCEKPLPSSQIIDSAMEETAETGKKNEREDNLPETDVESGGRSKRRAKDADEKKVKLEIQDFIGRSPNGLGQQCSGLEKAQLAAGGRLTRQSPCYPNDPEQWPESLGTREGSSKAHGVTDARNLVGLRHSIEGAAQDTGHCPNHWSEPVFEKCQPTLECPELLPASHPERARELQHPKADRLVKLTSLENADNQLCEHMEATDLTLVNPLANEDPVSVLPDGDKRHWAKKKTEATNLPSRINPDTRAGTRRRRRQLEKAELYCRKKSSRANTQQQKCYDHQLRFCREIGKLFDDKHFKIVARWEIGDGVKDQLEDRCQSNTRGKLYTLEDLPVVNSVSISAPEGYVNAIIFGTGPGQRYGGISANANDAATVPLVVGVTAFRPRLGDAEGKNGLQQKAEVRRAWPRFTRMQGWISTVSSTGGNNWSLSTEYLELWMSHHKLQAEVLSALYSSRAAAKDSRLEEMIGRRNRPAGTYAELIAGGTSEPWISWTMTGELEHGSEPDAVLQDVDRYYTKAEMARDLMDEANDQVLMNGGHYGGSGGNKLPQSNSTPLRIPRILAKKMMHRPTSVDAGDVIGDVDAHVDATHGRANQVCAISEENLQVLNGAQKTTAGNVGKATNLDDTKVSQEQEDERGAVDLAV
ncbi:uncharacterized protein LOC120431124 [Culex pipiens pallens]|uniref:uncharacterized protein LOC120431124 n=1 Tax=Culex pipiens pallens TaxID=42434 RepID=UPI0022AB4A46|nr:uncharacterized protein LOC120431124 [Culex pipiens pallens]